MRRYLPSRNASPLLPLLVISLLLSSWVAQQIVGVSSMAILPTNTNNHLKHFINSPHIGYIQDPKRKHEIYVIGTSHFKCNSAAEVSSLITSVKPDGVILELDPERTLRLTKQYYGFDAASSFSDDSDDNVKYQQNGRNKELLYGSDFVSAITTCQDMDIPLFWGDESVSETKSRLFQQLFRVEAYSPRYLMTALMLPMIFATTTNTSSSSAAEKSESTTVEASEESRSTTTTTAASTATIMSRINLLASFKADTKKLTPLAISSSPPLLVSALTLLFRYSNYEASAGEEVSIASSNILIAGTFNIIETILSIIISFSISCFLFNTVIVERDMILADRTTRALDTLRLLKDGLLIRKRWEFTVNNTSSKNDDDEEEDMDEEEANNSSSSNGKKSELPLFTLKTPLISGKIRNLNLFEPRWLKMIDSVAQSSSSSTMVSQQPQFGCVKCTNKFYSASSISNNNNNNNNNDSFIEGRYADIIFERKVTLASIVNLKEGKRPVSGDRKIGVTIQGGDEFSICDESSISVTEDGYMVANDIPVTKCEIIGAEKSIPTQQLRGEEKECIDDWVRVVVVVGLLHGNGVIELLSKKSVASPQV
jgi:hypothetical protein